MSPARLVASNVKGFTTVGATRDGVSMFVDPGIGVAMGNAQAAVRDAAS